MKLDEITSHSEVFIDANIFIYHFTGVSQECTDFLGTCEEKRLKGITSVNVVLEVLHRLMMIEAVTKGLVKSPNIVKKLNKNPDTISQLKDYFTHTMKIFEMGIAVRSFSPEIIIKSQVFRSENGLMTGDSLIAAIMRENNIKNIATNDRGFSHIAGLRVSAPGDVNMG